MGKIIQNGIEYSGTYSNATSINYDSSASGLNAKTMQEAVDEIHENLEWKLAGTTVGTAEAITYPSEAKELYIEAKMSNSGRVFSMCLPLINREDCQLGLGNQELFIILTYNNTDKAIKLVTATVGSTDQTSTTKISVYYK